MPKTFYVTTPIYYVNDAPHIGHAYTTIAADVIARFRRLMGDKVFFLTGTDEHGQKIERVALASGERPIELADRVVLRFKGLWDKLNIMNDDFIRTTEERHIKAVLELFQRVFDRGDIYLGEYEDWYCVFDETFLTETQLVVRSDSLQGERACPDCGRPVEKLKEESYFFRLSKYQDPLLEFYEDNPDFVQPSFRRNEVINFVKGGLRDLSISRTSFSWGIPIYFHSTQTADEMLDNLRDKNPSEAKQHVIYVWFDALTNYLTAAGFPDDSERFNEIWPADIHLVGKDILRFHTVYWPAFLISAGLTPPHKVFAHGWWTVEGEKMSKSKGNVVDPYAIIDEFGADVLRFFLLREVPFGLDGDFSRNALIGRINGDLANGLGNLVSRSLGMIEKYSGGKVPKPGSFEPFDLSVREKALATARQVEEAINEIAFHKALGAIWDFIATVNKYVDESAPWALEKAGKRERLDTVLWTLVESIRVITLLVYPFIPKSAEEIWERIGIPQPIESQPLSNAKNWGLLKPGLKILKGESLFPRYGVK
ncbi:MAG TPA: methionine--tRNA ligase [Thermodesulfobacteriota bacterium]|nr:methionine--tRNA ligase [Thermodesulfobacteriota bacterium]